MADLDMGLAERSTAGVIAFVGRKLGGGVMTVELTPEQLNDAVISAALWFIGYMGQHAYLPMAVSSSESAYAVPDDVEVIHEVIFPDAGSDLGGIQGWADVPTGLPGYTNGLSRGRGYTDIVLFQQQLEQARGVFGSDPAWEYDPTDRKLRIGKCPTGTIWIKYTRRTLDWGKIDSLMFSMIRDRALAEGMYTLGMIRTKYGEVPSADGTLSLNGDTLLSESSSMKLELDNKMSNLNRPYPFIIG